MRGVGKGAVTVGRLRGGIRIERLENKRSRINIRSSGWRGIITGLIEPWLYLDVAVLTGHDDLPFCSLLDYSIGSAVRSYSRKKEGVHVRHVARAQELA